MFHIFRVIEDIWGIPGKFVTKTYFFCCLSKIGWWEHHEVPPRTPSAAKQSFTHQLLKNISPTQKTEGKERKTSSQFHKLLFHPCVGLRRFVLCHGFTPWSVNQSLHQTQRHLSLWPFTAPFKAFYIPSAWIEVKRHHEVFPKDLPPTNTRKEADWWRLVGVSLSLSSES